jgi:hypothetical protein
LNGNSYRGSSTVSALPGNSMACRTGGRCSGCLGTKRFAMCNPRVRGALSPLWLVHFYPEPAGRPIDTWTENGATVNSAVISSFTDNEITMVDSAGRVKAQPGPLSGGGNGFSVTWKRST